MGKKVIIREAAEKDISSIVELWKEFIDFNKERHQFFTRTATGHEKFAELVARNMSSDNSCVFVAEQNGEILGYCQVAISNYPPVYETRRYGSILDLAVTKKYRRMGIGERLFKAAREWFCNNNIHRIEVPVAISNEQAAAFWGEMGFSPYIETLCMEV